MRPSVRRTSSSTSRPDSRSATISEDSDLLGENALSRSWEISVKAAELGELAFMPNRIKQYYCPLQCNAAQGRARLSQRRQATQLYGTWTWLLANRLDTHGAGDGIPRRRSPERRRHRQSTALAFQPGRSAKDP